MTETTEAEMVAKIERFGFDKAPNGFEQLAVAMTRCAAACKKLRESYERRSRS